MYFRNHGLQKMQFGKCLKSPVWEDLSSGNKVIELEKVTLSDMQSLKTFC